MRGAATALSSSEDDVGRGIGKARAFQKRCSFQFSLRQFQPRPPAPANALLLLAQSIVTGSGVASSVPAAGGAGEAARLGAATSFDDRNSGFPSTSGRDGSAQAKAAKAVTKPSRSLSTPAPVAKRPRVDGFSPASPASPPVVPGPRAKRARGAVADKLEVIDLTADSDSDDAAAGGAAAGEPNLEPFPGGAGDDQLVRRAFRGLADRILISADFPGPSLLLCLPAPFYSRIVPSTAAALRLVS